MAMCTSPHVPAHGVGIEPPYRLGRLAPRECRRPPQPPPDACLRDTVVPNQTANRIRDRAWLVWWNEEARIPGYLRQRSAVGGDDRHPQCHGLEHRKPESFVPRREDEERGTLEERAPFGIGDIADVIHDARERRLVH